MRALLLIALLLTASLALPTLRAAEAPDGTAAAVDAAIAARADVLILGETHDDPAHHLAQAAAIRHLMAAGLRPTVVFEMVPEDLQAELDALSALGLPAIGEVDTRLRWSERGWGDVALYRPVFEAALEAGLPMRAGDLTRDRIRGLAREGEASLASDEAIRIGLEVPLEPDAEQRLRDLLVASHCGMMSADDVGPRVVIQRARDGAMADAVRQAAANGPVVLITGLGHARRDWGVPAVLARTAPDLVVRSVALKADGAHPEGGFDHVIATGPSPEHEHPCQRMRRGG